MDVKLSLRKSVLVVSFGGIFPLKYFHRDGRFISCEIFAEKLHWASAKKSNEPKNRYLFRRLTVTVFAFLKNATKSTRSIDSNSLSIDWIILLHYIYIIHIKFFKKSKPYTKTANKIKKKDVSFVGWLPKKD